MENSFVFDKILGICICLENMLEMDTNYHSLKFVLNFPVEQKRVQKDSLQHWRKEPPHRVELDVSKIL